MKYLGNLIMRELLTRIWNDCPISQMSHVLRTNGRKRRASLTYSLKLFDKDGGAICRAEQGRWRRLHMRWFPLTCKQALFSGVMCDCFV